MPKNRKMQNIIGTEHITDAAEAAIAAQASGGATLAFKTVAVSGQSDIVADAATDTLTLAGAGGTTITTDAGTDTVTITSSDTQLSTEQVQDIVGAMFTGNTETNITATYEDSDGTIDLVASGGGGGGAISSRADLTPKPISSSLQSVSGAGNYQKTLGGAPFFLNKGSWSTVQYSSSNYVDGSGNSFVIMWPYLGSGETLVKTRLYMLSSGTANNDTHNKWVVYASDANGLPTGSPVNGGVCPITAPSTGGNVVIEGTWTNGPTLTSGELFWMGNFLDTASSDVSHDMLIKNIRATPNFDQEALGFSSNTLLLNNSNFGRITGLRCNTSTGTTNGSRTAPTIGAGTLALPLNVGFNVPRVSFEVTYS